MQGKKPRGYWDKLANVQREIEEFCEQQGLPPGIMPLKMDFVRANRYDLSHAIERWGGLYDLAELLDYQASPILENCIDTLYSSCQRCCW